MKDADYVSIHKDALRELIGGEKFEALKGACIYPLVTPDQVPFSPFHFRAPLSQEQRWNLAGKEPYRFHPSASHITPSWRDGWNAALDSVCEYGFVERRRADYIDPRT